MKAMISRLVLLIACVSASGLIYGEAFEAPALRQMEGGAKMRAVAAAWRDYFGG